MGPQKEQLKKADKIGRNSLCPCSSKLKFKHCHGNEKFRNMCQQEANRVANNMLKALIQQMQVQKGICPKCTERFTNNHCDKCDMDFITKEEADKRIEEEKRAKSVVVPSKKIILPTDIQGE